MADATQVASHPDETAQFEATHARDQTTVARRTISLADFAEFEYDQGVVVNSPRSLQACSSEGISPLDLVYRPIESFAERSLSPRLVKLRYDFFECKRKDLLASAKRARDGIVDQESRNGGIQRSMSLVSKRTGLGMGALAALQSNGLQQEREKMLRAQKMQQMWLKSALDNELAQLQRLEKNDNKLKEEGNDEARKQQENAQRMKEMNDRRRALEDQKAAEFAAQQKLERELAKAEFKRQQTELAMKQERELQKKREAHERAVAEQNRKLEAEREREEERQRQYELQQMRLQAMQANDERRMAILHQQQEEHRQLMRERQDRRNTRIRIAQANMDQVLANKRADFNRRQSHEKAREDRLERERQEKMDNGRKRSLELLMKRRKIAEDAANKLESRRQAIINHQLDIEHRMQEHEAKKEHFLDFKRELDSLREKNKQINVMRQRRKEEHHREEVAEAVRRKDEKIDTLAAEKNRLWTLRREAGRMAQQAKEDIKTEVTNQRIRSKFNSKKVEAQLKEVLANELFQPEAIMSAGPLGAAIAEGAAETAEQHAATAAS